MIHAIPLSMMIPRYNETRSWVMQTNMWCVMIDTSFFTERLSRNMNRVHKFHKHLGLSMGVYTKLIPLDNVGILHRYCVFLPTQNMTNLVFVTYYMMLLMTMLTTCERMEIDPEKSWKGKHDSKEVLDYHLKVKLTHIDFMCGDCVYIAAIE